MHQRMCLKLILSGYFINKTWYNTYTYTCTHVFVHTCVHVHTLRKDVCIHDRASMTG